MKNIVMCIKNKLLSESLYSCLKKNMELRLYSDARFDDTKKICESIGADVLLFEVRDYAPYRFCDFEPELKMLKRTVPDLKFAAVVDKESYPMAGKQVAWAKSDELIDAFFYSGLGGDYVSDVVASM